MSTHNMYFCGEITKIILKYPPYLFHCLIQFETSDCKCLFKDHCSCLFSYHILYLHNILVNYVYLILLQVESEKKFARIGGTASGGGTFWGLGSLLTKAKVI